MKSKPYSSNLPHIFHAIKAGGVTFLLWLTMAPSLNAAELLSPAEEYRVVVAPFLEKHCVGCHGEKKQAGDIRLDRLGAVVSENNDVWLSVRDQIRDGLMPPAKEPRPHDADARSVIHWISRTSGGRAARLPHQGNQLPHELLFGSSASTSDPPPPRIWRLSPNAYMGLVRSLIKGNPDGLVQPFTLEPERGIRDFAGLYTIDEPSTEVLIRNAEAIVDVMTGNGKGRNNAIRELGVLMDEKVVPSSSQLTGAIQLVYRVAIGRQAEADEVKRLIGLYEKCAEAGDRPAAVRTMLQAVLLKTDALFRSERGEGASLGKGGSGEGRRRLNSLEIAIAVSLTLGDHRESGLMAAANKGELTTREDVAKHIRRIMDDTRIEKPALLRFFREYFDYTNALNVFKTQPKTFLHQPAQLVADTDRLVLHVLAQDKDVFRTLLTTDQSFINLKMVKNKKTRLEEPAPGIVAHPINNKGQKGVEFVYGIDKWSEQQPINLPQNTRLGILMQPAWLVAYSTNFENDPVRRGRWVRERLLGGTVPELPIGVAAQIPDEPHRTLRDRLKVTRAASCWKCHQKMDDLGLVFENFDHYGRFRTTEEVVDVQATEKNKDKKGKSLGPVMGETVLNTSGLVNAGGEAKLDGPVKDPRELVMRFASSERVRQVFVRHVFRFFLGRNESLSDALTLQEADAAYVKSGGSFKALVISLLTSDSFLYRSIPVKGDNK